MGLVTAIRSLWNSEIIENYEDIELPPELKKAQEAIDEKKIVEGFNSKEKTSKGGFAKKINPDTEKAMRAMHSKVAQRDEQNRDER